MAGRAIESRVQTCRKVTAPFGRYFLSQQRPIQIRLTHYRVSSFEIFQSASCSNRENRVRGFYSGVLIVVSPMRRMTPCSSHIPPESSLSELYYFKMVDYFPGCWTLGSALLASRYRSQLVRTPPLHSIPPSSGPSSTRIGY